MTAIRVKGFHIYFDRHGKRRCYHRKTRRKIDLDKHPLGSASFVAEVARIGGFVEPPPRPGALGGLIDAWRASAQWAALAVRTRDDYETVLGFLESARDQPLSAFDPATVVRIRDAVAAKRGRRWGDYTKQVLSSAFSWGVERGFMPSNPARGLRSLPKPKGAPEANRPWTDAEREAAMAGLTGRLRVAVALCAYLGLDPQDAVALRKDAIQGDRVLIRRHKTGGVPYFVPILPPLADALATAPEHDGPTVVGGPWNAKAFGQAWYDARGKLGLPPDLTLKGLRHTLATIAREAGASTAEIAAILHHRTEAMARHYARRADRTREATAGFEAVGAELARRKLAHRTETANREGGKGG